MGPLGDAGPSAILALAALACFALLFVVRGLPSPGRYFDGVDAESGCLHAFDGAYWETLPFPSFAYLRLPLFVAGLAFLVGRVGNAESSGAAGIFSGGL